MKSIMSIAALSSREDLRRAFTSPTPRGCNSLLPTLLVDTLASLFLRIMRVKRLKRNGDRGDVWRRPGSLHFVR